MNERLLPALVVAAFLGGDLCSASHAAAQPEGGPPEGLDCAVLDCAAVLPGAARFEIPDGKTYAVGSDEAGQTVGWVVLSTDVTDVPAYSGKPLVTLVGLDTQGVISGARVVHHSEPILLVGIPESVLQDFADFYVGKRADTRVVVGRATGSALSVDVISGATVTALAQNKTILESARELGAAVGILQSAKLLPGHFVSGEEPWTWERMVDEGVFGRLTVTEEEMGTGSGREPFVDLWFTIADAPHVGRALLGDNTYEHAMEQLERDQHLFVVLGNGSSSFKGSAFVRGGIFDRVRLEQGLTEIVFRDTDYENLPDLAAEGAPGFREGALFTTRDGDLDPGKELTLVFLGSRYDGRGGFSRDFREFKSAHRLPESVYAVDGDDGSEAIWVQAWRNRAVDAAVLVGFLLLVAAVFIARKKSTGDMRRLGRLHLASMLFAFLVVGVYMSAQPSVTQILTFVDSLIHDFRLELFASEPLIFTLWIFIVIVSLIWGRGVFCGWVCPYGAMTELAFKLGKKVGIRPRELPDRWHHRLRYLRYGVLVGLVVVFLWDSILGEKLAEIEPFKSTFLVPAWERPWGFFAWWAALLAVSFLWYRPFCRYLCPLGGGLALLNSFRFSGPRRRSFCSSCNICARGCEPRAIRPDGTIDSRECLSCMECEAVYRDREVCPPLVGIDRLTAKTRLDGVEERKLAHLQEQAKDV